MLESIFPLTLWIESSIIWEFARVVLALQVCAYDWRSTIHVLDNDWLRNALAVPPDMYGIRYAEQRLLKEFLYAEF
jgi:hypothetical protein